MLAEPNLDDQGSCQLHSGSELY